MNQPADKSTMPEDVPRAKHGATSEVTWDGGAGRQPYANRGERETSTAQESEAAEGDRGELSGRTLEQSDAVRRKP